MFYDYSNKDISDSKLKTAIIGCGGIAGWKHMPNIEKLSNVEMTAFCDLIIEKAEEAAKKHGTEDAKVYSDYKELLKDESIDVVHVCTPNATHAEISIAALNAGKHVMCEKPMTIKYTEAVDMCEAAKRSGKLLTIGYQSRSSANSQYMRELVRQDVLGEIYYMKCGAMRRRGVPGWGVFIDKEQQGGGPLIDIATHSIDNTLFITGNYDVDYVVGNAYLKLAKTSYLPNDMGLYDPEKITTEDSAFGFVRFKNGATMVVESSWAINMTEMHPTTLCGTKAGATLGKVLGLNGDLHGSLYKAEIETNPRMRWLFKDENLTVEEYDQKQWYSAILNGTELLVKPEEAAVVTRIIEAIYTSSETGKPVFFD